jgi:uridine kinase
MDPVSMLVDRIAAIGRDASRPVLVAVDGGSGAGKSTFARRVGDELGAAVIDGDDFYAGGTAEEWDAMSAAEKAEHCIAWRRQRPVLETLARGEPASWHPYDWDTDDGRLVEQATLCRPAPAIILEGVYSARPELSDLFDLRVLYDAPADTRRRRILGREGEDHRTEWNDRWEEAERWYFTKVMPPGAFDLMLSAAGAMPDVVAPGQSPDQEAQEPS